MTDPSKWREPRTPKLNLDKAAEDALNDAIKSLNQDGVYYTWEDIVRVWAEKWEENIETQRSEENIDRELQDHLFQFLKGNSEDNIDRELQDHLLQFLKGNEDHIYSNKDGFELDWNNVLHDLTIEQLSQLGNTLLNPDYHTQEDLNTIVQEISDSKIGNQSDVGLTEEIILPSGSTLSTQVSDLMNYVIDNNTPNPEDNNDIDNNNDDDGPVDDGFPF